jgi:hypothetical protein
LLKGLRATDANSDDVAIRFWGGYGIEGTYGISLLRIGGTWSAKAIRIEGPWGVPDSIQADVKAVRRYVNNRSRSTCTAVSRIGPKQNVMWSDVHISESPKTPEWGELWNQLQRHGILDVPPGRVEAGIPGTDGHTYVVEVVIGNEYRGSVIPASVFWLDDPSEYQMERAVLQQVIEIADLLQTQLDVPVMPPN